MINENIISCMDGYRKIALAVSGGSDSMALLSWFYDNRPPESYYVIHVEHGIRGEASEADCAFVCGFCQARNVECQVFHVDARRESKTKKISLETAARNLRHAVFRQVCAEQADCVATAHHKSDRAETVLLRIARGTGVGGLVGMRVCDGHLFRPLLETSKESIMEYLGARGIPYRDDATNADTAYTRNFIRARVIPLWKERFPALEDALIRLSESAYETALMTDASIPVLTVENDAVILPKLDFSALRKEALRRACALLGVESDLEAKHYAAVEALARNGAGADLPGGLRAVRENGATTVYAKTAKEDARYDFGEGEYLFGESAVCVVSVAKRLGRVGRLYVDGDKIPEGAVLRTRREGDRFCKFGGGEKSLGDFFTDRKIPVRQRDQIAVIAYKSAVYAVCGVEISQYAAIDGKTKNIYEICVRSIYDDTDGWDNGGAAYEK